MRYSKKTVYDYDDIDQFEDVFLRPDIGEGVVFHALFEVDGVEDLDAVRLIDDFPTGVPHGLSVLVQLGGASPQHDPHLGQKLSFGISDHIAAVHLHEGGFDEEPGLAAAAAADDQDVFVPGVLGIFRAAGHGEFFRLGQRDVPVGDRIDIGGNIGRRAPSGAAVFDALAIFAGVFPFGVHRQPDDDRLGDAHQQVQRMQAGRPRRKRLRKALTQMQELFRDVKAGCKAHRLAELIKDIHEQQIREVEDESFFPGVGHNSTPRSLALTFSRWRCWVLACCFA